MAKHRRYTPEEIRISGDALIGTPRNPGDPAYMAIFDRMLGEIQIRRARLDDTIEYQKRAAGLEIQWAATREPHTMAVFGGSYQSIKTNGE